MIKHTYKCPKNADVKELKCDICVGQGDFTCQKECYSIIDRHMVGIEKFTVCDDRE